MRLFILVSLIALVGSLVYAETVSDYTLLKESRGVYQVSKEYQDADGKGIEIDGPDGAGKIRVKRTSALETIEGLGTEKNTTIPDIKIPESAFPLKVGAKWADDEMLADNPDVLSRKDNMYFNYVEKTEDVTVPAGTFKNCFKIVYRTMPDDTTEWFCPGVGIVKTEYHHHGTVMNLVCELKEMCKK